MRQSPATRSQNRTHNRTKTQIAGLDEPWPAICVASRGRDAGILSFLFLQLRAPVFVERIL